MHTWKRRLNRLLLGRKTADMEPWLRLSVKTGYYVAATFYAALDRDLAGGAYKKIHVNDWRERITANNELNEMELVVCRGQAREFTGINRPLRRSSLPFLIQHPYRLLPPEILAQLPTALEAQGKSLGAWEMVRAQPSIHDAGGTLHLSGDPSKGRPWAMGIALKFAWSEESEKHEPEKDPAVQPDEVMLMQKVNFELDV